MLDLGEVLVAGGRFAVGLAADLVVGVGEFVVGRVGDAALGFGDDADETQDREGADDDRSRREVAESDRTDR